MSLADEQPTIATTPSPYSLDGPGPECLNQHFSPQWHVFLLVHIGHGLSAISGVGESLLDFDPLPFPLPSGLSLSFPLPDALLDALFWIAQFIIALQAASPTSS